MDGKNEGRAITPRDKISPTLSFAHEINNPLETLVSLLYLIDSEPNLTDKVREYVRLARQEADRLSRVTHSALVESRYLPSRRKTNVPDLLLSILELYKSRFASHDITIRTRCRTEGNLETYPGDLRRSLTNLILNAADAMPNGGTMHVRVASAHEWTKQNREGLRVTVADNGCGIIATDKPKILNAYFTTKGASGTGVGLSIVSDTVHIHGGVLRFRSSTKPGRSGTVFTIFLPELTTSAGPSG